MGGMNCFSQRKTFKRCRIFIVFCCVSFAALQIHLERNHYFSIGKRRIGSQKLLTALCVMHSFQKREEKSSLFHCTRFGIYSKKNFFVTFLKKVSIFSSSFFCAPAFVMNAGFINALLLLTLFFEYFLTTIRISQ